MFAWTVSADCTELWSILSNGKWKYLFDNFTGMVSAKHLSKFLFTTLYVSNSKKIVHGWYNTLQEYSKIIHQKKKKYELMVLDCIHEIHNDNKYYNVVLYQMLWNKSVAEYLSSLNDIEIKEAWIQRKLIQF